MTQEDKQLLFKDLCTRLPYGVICHANKINLDGEFLFINKVYNIVALYNDKAIGGKFDTCPIADIKPYLRPMSSMTKEEDKEWQLYKSRIAESCDELLEERVAELHDWFNRHHFDYRGLIEKGLALEAPEGMYGNK